MRAFPFHEHTVSVFTIERPPPPLHQLMMERGYCVRSIFGHEIGDVLYVQREAHGGRLARRRFGDQPSAPCASHFPLSRNLSESMQPGDWCDGSAFRRDADGARLGL